MGLFDKLKAGLTKTRDAFADKVSDVFKVFVKVDEELFEELEEALISADIGVETSMYIIEQLRDRVKKNRITDGNEVKEELKKIIAEIMSDTDNESVLEDGKLNIILIIGVNGVGKTTTIGKLAMRLKSMGRSVILGAADTFRAAAIEQLEVWAKRADVPMVKHAEGADPAAVVYDTIQSAKAKGTDVIIIDTAGRLHNKKNLMDELNKISRVIDRELPDASRETLLILDATTGQNAVNQAKDFKDAAGITGIILTKLDGTARGGVVLAINNELDVPVKFVGVGEQIDDLQPFDADAFASALFDKKPTHDDDDEIADFISSVDEKEEK